MLKIMSRTVISFLAVMLIWVGFTAFLSQGVLDDEGLTNTTHQTEHGTQAPEKTVLTVLPSYQPLCRGALLITIISEEAEVTCADGEPFLLEIQNDLAKQLLEIPGMRSVEYHETFTRLRADGTRYWVDMFKDAEPLLLAEYRRQTR